MLIAFWFSYANRKSHPLLSGKHVPMYPSDVAGRPIFKGRTIWISIALGFVFGISVATMIPLAGALQFGGDEGYELMKGFLCSRGFHLYKEIWSDQPPLHTAILSFVFQFFGPSVLGARLITVGFASLLVGAFYLLVKLRSGHAAATLAALLLIGSSYFLQLSVSAMIVIPSVSLAVCSLLLVLLARGQSRNSLMFLSGCAMGLALQTKFTAALYIPAILVELTRHEHAGDTGMTLRRAASAACYWTAGATVSFGAVLLLYPSASIELLWRPHFSRDTWTVFAGSSGWAGMNQILWADLGLATAGVAGVIWVLSARRWELLPAIVALLTVYLAHLVHRPFWYFHYLHLAIPLAWLAAVALTDPLRWLWRSNIPSLRKPGFKPVALYALWAVVTALALSQIPDKTIHEWKRISAVENAADSPAVRKMTEGGDKVRWVFTDRAIDAFHARLPVIPELAVLSQKRYRSGQITPEQIVEYLDRYRPELVILHGLRHAAIDAYIARHYVRDPDESSPPFFRIRR